MFRKMAKAKSSFLGLGGGEIENSGKGGSGIAVGKRREKGNDDEVDYDRYFC